MSVTATAAPSKAAWCAHSALLGAALGLGLTLLDQILLPWLGGDSVYGDTNPSLAQRAAAVLIVGSGHALIVLVASAIASLGIRRATGRTIACGLVGLVISTLFAWHALGLIVRLLSGSFVTVGAIQFVVGCGEHFLHAVSANYLGVTLALITTTVAVGVATSLHLRRRYHSPKEAAKPLRVLYAGVGAPALLYASAAWAAPNTPFVAGVSQATPELAFIASLDPAGGVPMLLGRGAARVAVSARQLVGPPLSAEKVWEQQVLSHAGNGPNVLLMVLESVSTRHLGYLGYQRKVTPHLDRIAQRSLRMQRTWSTATHSNYAQPAILSSLFPRRGHGLDLHYRLDYPRMLFHDLFHRLDYATATISSQDEDWQGMRRFQSTGTPTFYWHSDSYPGPHLSSSSEKTVPDKITVGVLIDWLEKQQGRRWAVYVNLQSPHFPYRLPRLAAKPFSPTGPTARPVHYLGYAKRDRWLIVNRYDNALHHLDEQIGRLRAYLEEAGQLGNTLWVITADHGELFGEYGVVTHGRTLYEGETRVPLLLHWPARLKPGDVHEPVSHLDILPTISELVGLPPHPSFQGHSFASVDAHREARTAVFLNIQGLRTAEAIVCWPWKLIVERTGRVARLFNLEDDPDEHGGLIEREPGIAAILAEVLRKQMRAQISYHRKQSTSRSTNYAPRLVSCPDLPGQSEPEASRPE